LYFQFRCSQTASNRRWKTGNNFGRKPIVVCPHDPYAKRGSEFPNAKDQAGVLPHGRRISCLPAPSLLSGIHHRSEELKADIRHLSEKEDQGFHIRYRADEPDVEYGVPVSLLL
jgi:hypothetical protein